MNCTSKVLQLLLGLICFVQWKHVESKEFMRCELTKELINNNFDRTLLSNWVCMIEHESKRNSQAVIKKQGRKVSYGLFQINENDCGKKGAICEANCATFIDDKISDDAVCAKAIFKKHGFKYWSGWVSFCKVENLPNLNTLWVCMIEHESQRNTSKINPKPNKTLSYGLFQINSKEWCRPGRKGGICNAKCEDFIDERLTDDVACAKAIFNRDGFQHWQGWVSICREVRNRPDLNVLCRINQNWLKNYRQRIFKG